MALTNLRMPAAWLLVIVFGLNTRAQDTAFVYDIATGTESFIVLPGYDTTATADSLPPYYGNYGVTAMPTAKPVDTIPNTEVSMPFAISDSFSTFNFPFTGVTRCNYAYAITAAIVGRHAILVFNYDVYNTNAPGWRNPYPIRPFFNNGTIYFGYNQLTPVRFYGLSSLFSGRNVGIIEVAEDAGSDGGFFGLAYDSTFAQFNSDRLLYSLSYPYDGTSLGFNLYNDSVNGDTMYMRYGNVKNSGYPSVVQFGRGGWGEFVAPLFDDDFQIRAIRWDYDDYTVITPRSFNFLKYVLQNLATNVEEIGEKYEGFTVYPNPSTGSFYIKGNGVYVVYDVTGKQLLTGTAGKSFYLSTPGLYFVKKKFTNEVKKLLVTK